LDLPLDIRTIKGFLHPDEGSALHGAALARAPFGLCVEIGSYCGKSTVYLGAACRQAGGLLMAIDHHRGSEENQPGEEYFDPIWPTHRAVCHRWHISAIRWRAPDWKIV
jgi:hypothetical protein